MAIGSAIVLFVLGAILTFGIEADIAGLNIDTIGYILMGAGLIGGIIGVIYAATSGRRTTVVEQRPADGERVVEREYRR